MNAGAVVHKAEKNNIVRDASRRLSWNTVVASIPVGNLGSGVSRFVTTASCRVDRVRQYAQQTREEYREQIVVLRVRPLLSRHRLNAVLLHPSI